MNDLKSIFIRLFCLFFLTFSINQVVNAQSPIAAEIPVSYNVSASGAFTYDLPLRMPPGIKDMMPKMTISYNSQNGGNGMMGISWNLAGLSSISRGNSTIYHNNSHDPVDLDNNDNFLLDGQILFPVTAASGYAQYMTWIKNYADIKAYWTSSTGNSPDYFIVEYPNGVIYEYGTSSNSRMFAQGSTEVLMWAVNKIHDRNGNYIEFEYHNDQTNGEYRITKIKYTGNSTAAVSPSSEIDFNYITKPDQNRTWVYGSIVQDKVLLDNIEIKQNGLVVNRYDFTYHSDFYLQLSKITETRAGVSLPDININWGSSTNPSFSQTTNNYGTGWSTFCVGDFNGDGATDYIAAPSTPVSTSWFNIYSNNKDNTFTPSSNIPLGISGGNVTSISIGASGRIILDFNGDGYDDVFLVRKSGTNGGSGADFKIYGYISNGTSNPFSSVGGEIFSFSNTDFPNARDYIDDTKLMLGDFDGNGKKDLLVIVPSALVNGSPYGATFDAYLIGADYSRIGFPLPVPCGFDGHITGDCAPLGSIQHQIYSSEAGDFDGDGKTDFIITDDNPFALDCNIFTLDVPYTAPIYDGAPFTSSLPSLSLIKITNYPSHNHRIQVGDFNGDGRDDLLTWVQTNCYGGPGLPSPGIWDIAYSNGKFDLTFNTPFEFGGGGNVPFCGGSYHTSLPSVMNGIFDGQEPNNAISISVHVADFNGDGKDDICRLSDPGSSSTDRTYHMFYSKGYDNFEHETGSIGSFSSFSYDLSIGDFNGDGQADFLCHKQGSSTYQPRVAYFHANDMRRTITAIEHAGKTLQIGHISLAQKSDYKYEPTISTPGGLDPRYPHFSKQAPIRVVEELSDGLTLHNTYQYSTFLGHYYGLGFRGFWYTSVTDVTNSKITTHRFTFPRNSHMQYPFESYTWDLSTFNDYKNGLTSFSPLTGTFLGYTDEDGGNSGQIRNIVLSYKGFADYRTGVSSESNSWYSSPTNPHFYDFGQFDGTTDRKGGGTSSEIETVTGYTYDNSAAFYNRSKPIATTTIVTRNGKTPYTRDAEFQYNTEGLVSQTKADPGTLNEKTTEYLYDDFGNIKTTTLTAASGITGSIVDNFTYTSDGRFKSQSKNTLNYTSDYTYNDWGAVLTSTNVNANTSVNEYDVINRIKKSTDYLGNSRFTSYHWASGLIDKPTGSQFAITSSSSGISGSDIVFTDFYGRKLRSVTNNFNGTKLYTDIKYLSNGFVDYTTTPYYSSSPSSAIKTTYTYNTSDMLVQTANSATGLTITTSYNLTPSSGLETTVLSSTGQQKKYYTDNAGTQYKIDDNGNIIEYDFNSNGKPDEQKVNSSFVTTYTYDNFANLKQIDEPNAGTTKYDYNALGLITQKDENTKISTYTYDKLDRLLTSTEQPFATPYTYTYSNTPNTSTTGKILLRTSPHGTSYSYTYNVLGQLNTFIQTIGTNNFVTGYTYDSYGRVATQQYPSTDKIQNNYNAYGFHESIDLIYSPSGAVPQKLWRLDNQNNFGLTTKSTYFSNSATPSTALYTFDKSYNTVGLPVSRKVTNLMGSNTVVDFKYDFDNITGNLNYREDLIRSLHEDFTYDTDFDRLTSCVNNVIGSPVLTMEYNTIGNITHKSDVSDPLGFSPPVPKFNWIYDQYALKKLQSPQTANPTPYAIPTATQTVDYFPFNKVQKVSESAKNVEFIYWPDEQRATMTNKTDPGVTLKTKYYAAQYEKTVDAISGDVEQISYVFGGGEPIALLRHKTTGASTAFNVYYPITDHLGSITHVFDNQGTVNSGLIEERSFDAWGRYRNPANWQCYTNTTVPSYLFDRGYTAHEHMKDFNIINMNGRLYDPLVGRMFSVDPYVSDNTNSQSFNKYSYVGNNPLKYTDPSGNIAIEGIVIAGIIAGIVNLGIQAEKGNIHTGWQAFNSFYIGGLAGSSSAYIGGAITPFLGAGFWGGAAVGATASGVSAATTGAGNEWNNGTGFGDGILRGFINGNVGSISGGLTGGLIAGTSSLINGRNFWTGRTKPKHLENIFNVKLTGRGLTKKNVEDIVKTNQRFLKYQNELGWKYGGVNNVRTRGHLGITVGNGLDQAQPMTSTTYLNRNALKTDYLFYFTMDHEFTHVEWYADGTAAALFLEWGNVKIGNEYMSDVVEEINALNNSKQYVNDMIAPQSEKTLLINDVNTLFDIELNKYNTFMFGK